MSLRRVKTIYCASAITIALVLDCTGGMIGWIAAVVLLAGALPLFRLVIWASADATLNDVERRRANRRETSADETKDSGSSGTPVATLR